MVFVRLVKDFDFTSYPDWWLYPLISIVITGIGLVVGTLFSLGMRSQQERLQFTSLVAFQNSGYLPLALIASLLAPAKAGVVFIYLFLFLLGFNLIMFSYGVYMLTQAPGKRFSWQSLVSAPVISTLASLIVVSLGWQKFIPALVMKPLQSAGDCTLPLAMLIVGANIAAIKLHKVNRTAMSLMVLAKLVVLPLIGLAVVYLTRLPELLSLLIVLELAVPPAMNLSVIISSYGKQDLLISQGIFWGHVAGLVTIPLFLSCLYLVFNMIQ
jgi:hypothetical protein